MKKLTVKQHAAIQTVLYLLGIVLVLSYYAYEATVALWITPVCIVAGIVWRFLFIKCPHCGDKLTGSRRIPQCCPNCGKSLDENPVEES